MKRRVFAFVMALMMAALPLAGCQSGKNGSNIANESKSGVVRIIAVSSDGSVSFGSAFGVGEAGKETDVFVTNHHVAYDYLLDSGGNIVSQPKVAIYIAKNNGAWNPVTKIDTSQCVPCEVIYSPNGRYPDFVILRAVTKVEGRKALPLQDDEDSLRTGDQVYVLGYPGTSDQYEIGDYGMDRVANVEDVTITGGVVSRFTTAGRYGDTRLIQHDATINHGNSGGPLLDEYGAVVGINTYSFGMDPEQNIDNTHASVRIKYVKDALNELNIKYDVLVLDAGPNWLLIGGISLAVLILAVVVILVAVRSKKGKPGKGIPVTTPAPGPAAPAFAPAQEYRIQGVSGVFAGRRFAINEGVPVRIGTDPTANDLVFPAGTSGVSRRHCVLTLRNGQLCLQDLGSTYGTMAGTQRLVKDQPVMLGMGDRFCLGSDQQCFTITGKGGV